MFLECGEVWQNVERLNQIAQKLGSTLLPTYLELVLRCEGHVECQKDKKIALLFYTKTFLVFLLAG